MKPTLLDEGELKKHLSSLSGWTREGNSIMKTVKLKDFVHAMGFVSSVALLAEKLNLSPGKFSTAFQSRLTHRWLEPFTDVVLQNLASGGTRKVLVIAPSFVADCLETIIEIDEEYRSPFKKEGGEEFVMVKSMNDNDEWVKAIIQISDL